MSKNCVSCNSPMADDSKFCMICGASQPETAPQAAAQPAAQPIQPAQPVQPAQEAPVQAAPIYSGSSTQGSSQNNTGSTGNGTQSNSDYVYPSDKKIDAAVACVLSIFFPGVGQMINGQIVKGAVILGVDIVLGPLTCGVVALAAAVVAAIDAYKCTKALEEGITLRKWSFFGKP